jgi:hypothetical protein
MNIACKGGRVTTIFVFADYRGTPQPWLSSTGQRGYRRNQSKYQFATDTYENHCDSFCDRREANWVTGVLIGIPARTDLLPFSHHMSILDWFVVLRWSREVAALQHF